jgi:hypothetical protein
MASDRKELVIDALPSGKGVRAMPGCGEKEWQLTKEDLILILLSAGTVWLAIWIGWNVL